MRHHDPPGQDAISSSSAFGSPALTRLIQEALQVTPDGIGIFDPDDRLVFSNEALARLFGSTASQALGQTFEQIIRHAHASGNGVLIETDDIEQWLTYAKGRRRSQDYRSFQVDTTDGRWMQLTEQLISDGYLFTFCTDITEQKRLETQLQQLTCKLKLHAETDELTGISNRRHFFERAEREIHRCRREGGSVALLLLDLDHFKRVNDHYGHQRGDEVLCCICRTLEQELRDYDVLGRIGGEEFALLIPGAGKREAVAIAERLRRRVAELAFAPSLAGLAATLSIGIAVDRHGEQTLGRLIGLADKSLYRAKHEGRNRWCLASPDALPGDG